MTATCGAAVSNIIPELVLVFCRLAPTMLAVPTLQTANSGKKPPKKGAHAPVASGGDGTPTPTKGSRWGSGTLKQPISSRASGTSAAASKLSAAGSSHAVFSLNAGEAKVKAETLSEIVAKIFSQSYSPGRELRGVPPSAAS